MYISLHVNYQLFLSDFNEIRIFSIDFQKKSKISNLTKIHPVGAKLFHEDRQAGRQADMAKLILAFRNFAKAPKKCT